MSIIQADCFRRQRDIEENDLTMDSLENSWRVQVNAFQGNIGPRRGVRSPVQASPDAGPYTKGRVEEGVFRHFPSSPPRNRRTKAASHRTG